MNNSSEAYRVTIRQNLVIRIAKVADGTPGTDNLSNGTRLAMNHQRNGCIDGEYDFSSIHSAKDFAVLSLDFVKRLASRNLEDLQAHNFYADPTWDNPLAAGRHGGKS